MMSHYRVCVDYILYDNYIDMSNSSLLLDGHSLSMIIMSKISPFIWIAHIYSLWLISLILIVYNL